MANKKKIDRTAVERKIFDTVSDIFANSSPDRLTTDLIASRAGISKRALYECFKTKDELISGLFRAFIKPYGDRETEIFESDRPVKDKLLALAELSLRLNHDLGKVLTVMLKSLSPASTLPESGIYAQARRTHQRLNAIFAEGINAKVLRDIEPQEYTILFFGMVKGIHARRSKQSPDDRPPIADDVKLAVKMFLRGVSAGGARA